tara:strand:- start:3260 stop:3946 length:687 start_codon:yes stop_codon:yes gene_type:complete
MKNNIISIFLITQIFAFGGFGVYGNIDSFSATPEATTSGSVTVTPQSLDGAAGIGLFFYLDILPIVDLQIDYEIVGNAYKFTTNVGSENIGEFPWGRVSGYYTLRKELIGASIPFLAKVQVYGGLGYNTHTVTPAVTVNFIRDAFTQSLQSLEDAAGQDFSDDAIMNSLVEYMTDNAIKTSGFHLQVGAQAKLLMLNVFANARYTIANDVIEGKSGFPSLWTGIAIGF